MKYKKVLLIDDDEVDLYISKRIIRTADFATEIVSATSSAGALEYLKNLDNKPEELPEIIFLDMIMPVNDGYEFLEEFKKLGENIKRTSKVVILSNNLGLDPKTIEDINNNPAVYRILSKPLSLESIQYI